MTANVIVRQAMVLGTALFLTLTTQAHTGHAQTPPARTAGVDAVDIGAYLPLVSGSVYSYTDVISGDDTTLQVTRWRRVDGSNTYKLEFAGGDYEEVSMDSKGFRMHSRRGRDRTMPLSPAVILAGPAAGIGDAWSTVPSYRDADTGNRLEWNSKLLGFEDVSTPAGSFANCLKLEITVKDSRTGTRMARYHKYLARDVGLVKRQGQAFGVFFAQVLSARSAR